MTITHEQILAYLQSQRVTMWGKTYYLLQDSSIAEAADWLHGVIKELSDEPEPTDQPDLRRGAGDVPRVLGTPNDSPARAYRRLPVGSFSRFTVDRGNERTNLSSGIELHTICNHGWVKDGHPQICTLAKNHFGAHWYSDA